MNDQPDSDLGQTAPLETHDDDATIPSPGTDTLVLTGGASRLRRMADAAHQDDTAPAAPEHEIILIIRGMTEQIFLKDNLSIVLGRSDHKTVSRPDIDLTRFGAAERGVSREHARLELKDGKLYIIDLGSTNGSYFRGERLTPDQPQMLRRGDEIILGRLAVQVMFG
jgi:pSer/pThr/pTyr-binding forkhead associated (FHA) protein